VTYSLTNENSLLIDYRAKTDDATPINLTHHGYFNLSGNFSEDVLGHELEINADHFTPVGPDLIPTGSVCPVAGTPLDFRTPVKVGARIEEDDEQLRIGGGYDHNFVLNPDGQGEISFAARVYEPRSGRVMEVHTSEPGVQFYTGNYLQDFRPRAGFCLETQHFPDSPNQPGFPSTILRPGQVFTSRTAYSFFSSIGEQTGQ
jgi:aldose 1-epimerase